MSHILGEIRELAAVFQGFKLLYGNRQCNGVAHLTVKEALDIDNTVLYYDVIPGFLLSILQTNMPSLYE